MGRIRTVKPEFFTSPDTAKASTEARLFYIALWCWADDWGIGEANLNALLGFAFPEDDDKTRKEVQSLCKEVADAYGTLFYEVEGRYFYAIPAWDEHQRTQRRAQRRNPTPDDPEAVPDKRIYGKQQFSLPMQGSSAPTQGDDKYGTGEQGNRGTGEHTHASDDAQKKTTPPKKKDDAHNTDPDFAKFWEQYPLKKEKKRAHDSFLKAIEKVDLETLIQGAINYTNDSTRDPQFTKHASTWLNNNGWEDNPNVTAAPAPQHSSPDDPRNWNQPAPWL